MTENLFNTEKKACEYAGKTLLGLDANGRLFQWDDSAAVAAIQLSTEVESWCRAQKLPYIRLDDLEAKGYLTQTQKADLAKYRERWDALEQAQVGTQQPLASREVSKKMKTTLFWEVDEIVHGKLKPAGSGSTTVDGGKADAIAHWDKYFAPHGFRLARIETA